MEEATAAQVRKEFESFDQDDNGLIDYREFAELMGVLSPKTDPAYFEGGFSLIDENDDGFINFEEFLIWWQEAEWEK